MSALKDKEFIVFDVETTGLSAAGGDRVIELAAVKMRNGRIIGRFESLINPQRGVSYSAYLVNGISDEMLSGAPAADEVLPEFLEFIEGCCLVGHNVKFDIRFFHNELSLCGYEERFYGYEALDTVRMARSFLPQLGRYSLSLLSDFLKIRHERHHRAMSDVMATAELFQRLLDLASERRLDDFDRLHNLFGLEKFRQAKKHKLSRILSALQEKINLCIIYHGKRSGTALRDVTPLKLEKSGREATLVGHCHWRKAERNFIVNNMIFVE